MEKLEVAPRQPRKNSSIGYFGPYDANIIGGLLIGAGMATTGACPGTVLVQIATGIKSGRLVALGGLVGGALYARFGRHIKASQQKDQVVTVENHTISSKFGMDSNQVLLAFEIMCLAVAGASALLGLKEGSPGVHPVLGGALISGAQAASVLLTGSPVGVSTAYDEAGQYFWRLFKSPPKGPSPPTKAMTFAAGILLGSLISAPLVPITSAATSPVSNTSAIIGGCIMVFGARLAGGCTSGHGISGLSMFSISSVITVAAMFGGGIATALMLQ